MAENALVLVTGLVIGCGAWLSWQNPHAPDAPFLGIAIDGTAGVINLVWALMLVRCGRAQGSPTLVAIGSYLMMGILTSSAVLAGFAFLPLMGWLWLDPAIATLVALNVLWTGYCMMREPISGLEGLL